MLKGKLAPLALAAVFLAAPGFSSAEPDDDYLVIIDEMIKQNSPLGKMIIETGKKTMDALDGRSPREIRRNLERMGIGRAIVDAGMQSIRENIGDDAANAIQRKGEQFLQSGRNFLNRAGTGNSGGSFDPYSARGKSLWPR